MRIVIHLRDLGLLPILPNSRVFFEMLYVVPIGTIHEPRRPGGKLKSVLLNL